MTIYVLHAWEPYGEDACVLGAFSAPESARAHWESLADTEIRSKPGAKAKRGPNYRTLVGYEVVKCMLDQPELTVQPDDE